MMGGLDGFEARASRWPSILTPTSTSGDDQLGEFILPYEVVRTAPDPARLLLSILLSTYEAAGATARWDRAARERAAP